MGEFPIPMKISLPFLKSLFRITTRPFTEADLTENPTDLFSIWWDRARKAESFDHTACALATSSPDGKPSVRIVLLKSFHDGRFVFFTNYESRKATELEGNARVALCFHWPSLLRQVRIEGKVTRVTEAESDAYFNSRPRGSRLGAIASRQSRPLATRSDLEAEVARLDSLYSGRQIPRPAYWGGYAISARQIEFWQARVSRLHDRFVYDKNEGGSWGWKRLSP